jgi:ribosomal-protein-alanine N-acetyltransferase
MNLDVLFESFPEIENPTTVLRRIQANDAKALFAVLPDIEVTRHYDDAAFTDMNQAREQIDAWEHGYRSKRCIRWGIALKDDPTLIGSCGYYGFHPWHMRGSIGYELNRGYWRRGFMSEALSAIVTLGFEAVGLNRIEAVVMPENTASIRLLERLGFQSEGVLREFENWGDKGFPDLQMLSLLRKDWDRSRSE